MIRARDAARLGMALAACCGAGCAAQRASIPAAGAQVAAPALMGTTVPVSPLTQTLDSVFSDPIARRALLAVRVESLHDGRLVYARNPGVLVMPGSTMKIVTAAVAAEELGWDFRFRTRLEVSGPIADGVLTGDVIVTGGGDPSIAAQDLRAAPLFSEWSQALESAGIRRIQGRIIGDDNAFDDEAIGAGWAWDYLTAGYAAPSGALSYNENVVVARARPGPSVGAGAVLEIGPPGHELDVVNEIRTGAPGSPASIAFTRRPASSRLTVTGSLPLGSSTVVRTTTIDNPTRFFVEGFRLALAEAGIMTSGGAWDIDALEPGASAVSSRTDPAARRVIAEHVSAPLSSLIGYAMKVSQNFYGDMLLKAIARASGSVGTAGSGRRAVTETLAGWNLPVDSLVMYDGSGLSRYNYLSADLLVGVLRRAWTDERLRGPFVASLPVSGHDGTLQTRMRNTVLDRRVQAKTGTISNVRSLAGYAESTAGEKLVFAIVVNNYTAPNAQIDAMVEKALEEIVTAPAYFVPLDSSRK